MASARMALLLAALLTACGDRVAPLPPSEGDQTDAGCDAGCGSGDLPCPLKFCRGEPRVFTDGVSHALDAITAEFTMVSHSPTPGASTGPKLVVKLHGELHRQGNRRTFDINISSGNIEFSDLSQGIDLEQQAGELGLQLSSAWETMDGEPLGYVELGDFRATISGGLSVVHNDLATELDPGAERPNFLASLCLGVLGESPSSPGFLPLLFFAENVGVY